MGFFDSIRDAIFRRKAQSTPPTRAPGQPPSRPAASPGPRAPSTGNGHARAAEPVDVEAILTSLAAKNPLGYTGDMNDSAAMNIWLHKQVMRKLGESGGKVPAELR